VGRNEPERTDDRDGKQQEPPTHVVFLSRRSVALGGRSTMRTAVATPAYANLSDKS
jgi:hypothetical protein